MTDIYITGTPVTKIENIAAAHPDSRRAKWLRSRRSTSYTVHSNMQLANMAATEMLSRPFHLLGLSAVRERARGS